MATLATKVFRSDRINIYSPFFEKVGKKIMAHSDSIGIDYYPGDERLQLSFSFGYITDKFGQNMNEEERKACSAGMELRKQMGFKEKSTKSVTGQILI